MHYYQFNIADYRKDAYHLTPVQQAIYRYLIDEYHLTEKPIKNNCFYLMRRIGLDESDRYDLELVLLEFFQPACEEDYRIPDIQDHPEYVQNGESPEIAQYWVHKRIDSDIQEYRKLIEKKSKAGKASAESKKKNSTDVEHVLNTSATNHKPITNNHKPITNIKDISANADCETSKVPPRDPCPYSKIIDLYHEHLPMCPRVVQITEKRKTALRARWKNGSGNLEFWEEYFKHASESKFLTGQVNPPPGRKTFIADIDFLIRPDTPIKMQEGKYHD